MFKPLFYASQSLTVRNSTFLYFERYFKKPIMSLCDIKLFFYDRDTVYLLRGMGCIYKNQLLYLQNYFFQIMYFSVTQ